MQRPHVSFEKLDVFQKAYDLSLAIHQRSLKFPQIEQWELASQMRRSSKSICANLVEGMGKQMSAKDVIRFLRMSLGSCEETRLWLKYSVDLSYLTAEEFGPFDDGYGEVGRMLNGLIKYWSSKQA
jgi:four helix bundle protein